MNPFDESTLEREGARAAQAGRGWQSNPYLRRENMPQATGETLREWSRKHDAWQRGFEGRGRESAFRAEVDRVRSRHDGD